jgi:hypothetical protein
MLIPNKYNGYSADNRRLYYFGGDDDKTPEKTTQVSDLPEWAKPYAKEALEKGRALTATPYQAYTGTRIAGFSPMQMQAQQSAAGLDAGPQGFAQNVGSYMNPYMQNVVDIQKRELGRQSAMAGQEQAAGAVQRGAFGGSRDALMRAERERNLSQQMGDVQARGSQAAYEQAANQFRQGIGQQQNIIGMQSQLGGQEQALRQQGLTQAYQDFLAEKQAPYSQLGYMSDMIRGLPLGQQTSKSIYEAPGNSLGQVAGLGLSAYNAYNQFTSPTGSAKSAGGGLMESYADGGSVTSYQNIAEIVRTLSDEQLQKAMQNAQARNDVNAMQAIQSEVSLRASEQRGMASAFNQLPQETQDGVVEAAGGGIIAFADGDMVSDPMGTGASEMLDTPYQATGMTGLQKFMSRFQNEPEWKIKEAEAKAMKEAKASQAKPTAPSPKVQPKGQAARSTPAAIAPDVAPAKPAPEKVKTVEKKFAELANAPTPSKAQVKSAVDQLAEKNNLSGEVKDDVIANALKIREEFGKQDKPFIEEMRKFVEQQKPNLEEIRGSSKRQALIDFGARLAEESSKRGRESHGKGIAGLLSAAAASTPTLSAAAAKMQDLEATAKKNFAQLKMDQTKYEFALQKGDMQSATTLAGQIRQGQQQDKTLQFQIAKAQDDAKMEERKLAQTAGYYDTIKARQPENIMSLATQLMKDPAFKGSQNDAITQAAHLLKGGIPADIRAGTASSANLDKALKDISTKYPLLKIMKTTDPEYPSMKAAYDRDVAAAYARHGNAGISGAVPSAGKKPSGVTVTEIGQ